MEKNLFDDNNAIALIGLLTAALIVVTVMFTMTYMAERQRDKAQSIDIQSCYLQNK
ncbi:hypothetical protein ND440_09480 [Yersinia ruckeri]|uniref:hypothetical protein n=1 Tax=Yersinia ruckeri TaxID=29486 RepID=UPI0020C044E5|nr:hypothetical protein [Yersinia ruckeri]MCW6538637.1 hypothetical protein [Yersinia ruckeri]MCW6638493.1 hypothetical protein [Yersinia ruckeri]UZX63929.1 hypothetical protein ND440_09480 [Yersinia ruckeri]UZY10180.1 hypothetical protein LNQ46_009575 [Yersinia ruckeri]